MNIDNSVLKTESQDSVETNQVQTPTGFKKWMPLIILSLALMIIILDTTILNVSLRTIIDDLHTNIQSIQWVITAYSLMLAAFTVTGGRLGDLFGRKRMFAIGAVIFAVGSFMTSISHTVGFMILGEAIVEGIGAAMMMPATASLLVSTYKGRDRQIAFGIWGGIAASAAALGPVFGGWLTTSYSWRWAFRINVFVALVLVAGSFLIKEAFDREEKPSLDFGGMILAALGLLSIVFGFIKATDYGWFKAKDQLVVFSHALNFGKLSVVPLFILLGLIILAIFAWFENWVQKRGNTPLVSLKIFKNSQFTLAAGLTAILSLGQAGLSFAIPVFLQGVKNLDALHTGFAMLPMSLSLFVAAPFSGYISKYFKPKHIIQVGVVLDGLAFIALALGLKVTASPWALAPGFILFGAGAGLMMSQTSNMALSAVSVQEAGEASGVNNTLRQVGATLGSAVLGAILISALATNLTSGINSSSAIPIQLKPIVSQAVANQTSNIEFGGGADLRGSNIPAAIGNEIINISHQATVDASKQTMYYAVIFIVLAFILSFWLPSEQDVEKEISLAEKQEQRMVPRKQARIGALALALILAILAGSSGYAWGRHDGKNAASNNTSDASTAISSITNSTGVGITDASTISRDQTSPSTQSKNMKTYSSKSLAVSFNVPSTWKISESNGTIQLSDDQGNKYSIQEYSANTSDINALKNFLSKQSNMHNLSVGTFNGIQAVLFNVDGAYKKGAALLQNGRLFYLLGPNLSQITNFQV